jgi:branched-chain amino acid transport system ATP-binding protein
VEQNVRMALKVSDYAYVLSEGRTESHGPSRQVEQDASVQATYLGI